MRVLLVRVGADTTADGGSWNAPVDSRTGLFAYVPIPEKRRVRPGTERPYSLFEEAVLERGGLLPIGLLRRHAHLDPDFEHLTYGHPYTRARRIRECGPGDVLAFYSALRDTGRTRALQYALIGLLVVDEIVDAASVPTERYDENAHTRRDPLDPTDIVVRGRPGESGRLERCLPFCEYRKWQLPGSFAAPQAVGRDLEPKRVRRPRAVADLGRGPATLRGVVSLT